MAWVRVDDKFPRCTKVIRAAMELGGGEKNRGRVLAVWLDAMAYCNSELTDGFVPKFVAETLADVKPLDVFKAMTFHDERIGPLAEAVAGGWMMHNYAEYQPTKAETERKRREADARKEAWKERQKNANGTRSNPVPGREEDKTERPPVPTHPNPTQPDPSRPQDLKAEAARPAPINGTHYTTAENDAWAAETGVTLIPRGQIRKPRTGIDQSYRHRSCIGGGSWASCARGVCVPPNLARQWMDQGFDEAYCAKLTADYLDPIMAGTPLESDGYRLWRGVWSAVHQPEVPRAPTAREKNTPMAVLERNWETTLAQFPSHADMMAEALADERRKQDERAAQRLLKAGAR